MSSLSLPVGERELCRRTTEPLRGFRSLYKAAIKVIQTSAALEWERIAWMYSAGCLSDPRWKVCRHANEFVVQVSEFISNVNKFVVHDRRFFFHDI